MVGGWVGGGEQAQFCHGHEQNSDLDRDASGSSWTRGLALAKTT